MNSRQSVRTGIVRVDQIRLASGANQTRRRNLHAIPLAQRGASRQERLFVAAFLQATQKHEQLVLPAAKRAARVNVQDPHQRELSSMALTYLLKT